MPRTKKSATDVKIDFLVKEMKEMKTKIEHIEKQINFSRGGIWVLIFLGTIATSIYNYFTK